MVPNTILTHELIGITVKTASRTAAPPFSRLHGGQAKRPKILTRNIGLSADMINAFANSDSATVQADASTMSGLDGTLDVNVYFAARNVCEAGN